jgi:APA family basic amino acid/polyamine antiporter
VALTLYIAMSLVLTGIVRYDARQSGAGRDRFRVARPAWVAFVCSRRSRASPASCSPSARLRRIWFAEPRRPAPGLFAKLHPRFQTPYRPTLIAGALTALVAALYPIKEVAELVNIGTLSAFVVICSAIIVLRRTRPDVPRSFRAPFVPFTPLAGIGFSLWLL